MSTRSLALAGFSFLALGLFAGCNEPCPHYAPNCADASPVPTGPAVSQDLAPGRYGTSRESASGLALTASTGAIRTFLGTDSFKLVLGTGKHLYLLLPDPDTSKAPRSFRVDRGDEGPNGNAGWPNEPQFSPDGHWIAYAGDFPKAKTNSYVREAIEGTGWRIPLVRADGPSAQPHWYKDANGLWIFLSDVSTTTSWDAVGQRNNGNTWKAKFLDTAVSAFEQGTVGSRTIPGAFKGGISPDGHWVGTSYQTSVLWDATSGVAHVLNGGMQQCNPSMNPFSSGSNSDYMMILGFGGATPVPTLAGSILEGQHENLWIWSKDDKAVWRAALPNTAPHPSTEIPGVSYYEWQRPRWSTHPDFATAFAKQTGSADGVGYDLVIVKLGEHGGELASHDRTTLLERGPVLRIATGSLISSDWSHLWVKP